MTLTFPAPYLIHFPSPLIVQGGEGELAWEKRITVSHEEAFHRELRVFYRNIREDLKPTTSVDEAVKHMRFIQEVIQLLGGGTV